MNATSNASLIAAFRPKETVWCSGSCASRATPYQHSNVLKSDRGGNGIAGCFSSPASRQPHPQLSCGAGSANSRPVMAKPSHAQPSRSEARFSPSIRLFPPGVAAPGQESSERLKRRRPLLRVAAHPLRPVTVVTGRITTSNWTSRLESALPVSRSRRGAGRL